MVEKNWFQRIKDGIITPTQEKMEAPDGFWHKCSKCKTTITKKELAENLWVCGNCDYHERISAEQYFEVLFDDNKFDLYFENLESTDFLEFNDLKSYKNRLEESKKKTNLTDAMKVALGEIKKQKAVVAAMDFKFIGGSLGSVMGEKIARAVDLAIEKKCALIIVSKSGGARMMESATSLMQMAKTSAKLNQLSNAKLPYISLLTDPTTGGVTASFAMLGDVHIAEPEALIGFAGPRVIKETIKKDLPKGFQRSEFLMEKGFIDIIAERKNLNIEIGKLIKLFAH